MMDEAELMAGLEALRAGFEDDSDENEEGRNESEAAQEGRNESEEAQEGRNESEEAQEGRNENEEAERNENEELGEADIEGGLAQLGGRKRKKEEKKEIFTGHPPIRLRVRVL